MDRRELIKSILKEGAGHGLELDLFNPKTIQDKINWLKIYDVSQLKADCADKVKIHEYSKRVLGKDICIPILSVYDDPKNINFDALPNSFVLKCNHGYNMNIICRDKSKLNKSEAISNLSKWLKKDFGTESKQLHYSLIDRKCFSEQLMVDETQQSSLIDYKFWCFNGVPKLYTINAGNGHGDIVYFDMDGNTLNPYMVKIDGQNTKKPSKFNEMVEYAKKLSKEFKFVRVDFYEVGGRVYLGEMTFTPGNGMFKYKDEKYNKQFGDYLNLSNYKDGVSICITAYKAQNFIEDCLDSIERQTWFKTHNNWEVLIGVDGCMETLQKIQSIRRKYRNLRVFMMGSNMGTYVTTNTIMKLAKYNGLIRFDADDMMEPNLVEAILTNKGDADAVYFKVKSFGNSNFLGYGCGQIWMKHKIFDFFGGYKDYRCSSDYMLMETLKKFANVKFLDMVLVRRRVHSNNLTVAKETSMKSVLRMKVNNEIRKTLKTYSVKEDGIINTVTNTYTEIMPSTNISSIKPSEKQEDNLPKIETPIEKEHHSKPTVFFSGAW